MQLRVLAALVVSIFLLCLFPATVLSDVIVSDMIALTGKKTMLRAETKGKFFTRGGEVVEFFVDGKTIGKSLSGGNGIAFKQFTPLKTGTYQITVKSGKNEGMGLLLSVRKGEKIIFIDAEGGLVEGLFSRQPRPGSQKIIKKISGRLPVVFLQTGLFGRKAVKTWLKENGFKDLPVIPWEQGMIFDEINGMGLKIKAIIGSQSVIESAKAYKPLAFSFEEGEETVEVKDWEEIGRKLLKVD